METLKRYEVLWQNFLGMICFWQTFCANFVFLKQAAISITMS